MTSTGSGERLAPSKYLQPDEVKRLRSYLADEIAASVARGVRRRLRDAVFAFFLLDTGCRRAEAVAITLGDVRLDRAHRAVHVRRGKGGKARSVTLGAELANILGEYIGDRTGLDPDTPLFAVAGRPISLVTAWRIWVRQLRAVGLDCPGRGCHAARHTRATLLYGASRDLRLVARELGHADTRTTLIYADSLDEDRIAAADAVDARFGSRSQPSARPQVKHIGVAMKRNHGRGGRR